MTPPARNRLTALLGMTGSCHDGEALNALRIAQKLMKAENVTWEDTLHGNGLLTYQEGWREGFAEGRAEGYAQGLRDGKDAPRPRPASWQAIIREMLEEYADDLTEWEEGFLDSFRRRGWHSPSERQRAVLERIADKLELELPGD